MKSIIRNTLPVLFTVAVVTAMAAAAEFSAEKEILFPEIAAISAGALISPEFAWNTSTKKLFVFIIAGAILGMATVLLPVPLLIQMPIAFLVATLLFQFSGTTFAPMISAVVLPVMLGTKTPVYIVSASVLTLLILVLRKILEKMDICSAIKYKPVEFPDKHILVQSMLRWIIGSSIIITALISGVKFAAAPPLLVAFTEFMKRDSKAVKSPVITTIMITGCAFIGALMRYIFIAADADAYIAAGLTMLFVCILMRTTGRYLPPAAALSILTFLIPETSLIIYPLQIAAGTLAFMSIALVYKHITEKILHIAV